MIQERFLRFALLFFILDGPHDLVLSHVKGSYHPGETITASVSGRPTPTISWTRLDGGGPASVPGNTLTILSSMEGNNTYRCDATNTLVNDKTISIAKTVSFTVTGKFDGFQCHTIYKFQNLLLPLKQYIVCLH